MILSIGHQLQHQVLSILAFNRGSEVHGQYGAEIYILQFNSGILILLNISNLNFIFAQRFQLHKSATKVDSKWFCTISQLAQTEALVLAH